MFRAVIQVETVHWLVQAIGASEPFAAITGDAGIGKSAVAAEAAEQLAAHGYVVISAAPPFAGPLELQATLAEGLGLRPGPQTTPAAIAAALRDRALDEPAKPAVLLVDGADALPPNNLQYLWLMHRLCGMGRPALQTVFIGRFAFWDHVAVPELAGLHSAIAARAVLLPFPEDEALAYLRYRLFQAGAAEPAPIPRGLAQEVLTLGKGTPGRINAIADAVAACEPQRLRVTRRGVDAAVAALAGGSAVALTPAPRPVNVRFVVAGGVATVALVAGWLLLPQTNPWAPARVASAIGRPPAAAPPIPAVPATPAQTVEPTPPPAPPPAIAAMPDPPAPAPVMPAPVTSAPVTSAPVTPVPVTPAPVTPEAVPQPPTPDPPPAEAVTVAPPIVVLPDAAMARITVQYPQADPGVAGNARAVVAMLRARGLSVGDPTPVAAAVRSTTVEYYFVEDRGEAAQLARELGGTVGVGRIDRRNPDLPPPPGTLRVLLSNRTLSTPTSPSAPASAEAQPPISQEPP